MNEKPTKKGKQLLERMIITIFANSISLFFLVYHQADL